MVTAAASSWGLEGLISISVEVTVLFGALSLISDC
jgi:hypothetical protein